MNLTARPSGHKYLLQVMEQFGSKGSALIELAGLDRGPGDERPELRVENGIAIFCATGVLRNGARYWWDETGYPELQREIATAEEDEGVKGGILVCSTPGGETDGCWETAEALAKFRKKKPLYGVADDIAYSAGYWLISQCSRIYVPKMSGGVGSVGVWCAHFDLSGYLAEAGIKVTLISQGEGKLDGNPYEPLDPAANKRLKKEVARIYSSFVAHVATGRGKPESAIVSLGALLYDGSEASIQAGLADRAGSPTDAFNDIVGDIAAKPFFPNSGKQPGSARAENEGANMDELETARTEGRTAGETTGRAAAKKEERERASAITTLCNMQRKPELAAGFIASDDSLDTVITKLGLAAAAGTGDEIDTSVPGRELGAPGKNGKGVDAEEKPVDMGAAMKRVLARKGVTV